MKKLGVVFRVLLTILVVVWVGLIITEYIRFDKNEPMLAPLKTEVLKYEDGEVYVSTGLGYKSIIYNITSLP